MERWVGPFGSFCGLPPGPAGCALPGESVGRKGIGYPAGKLPPPKPSPWGEGGPAKPGRMRGRPCTQPFLVEKRCSPACRLNGIFLLPRWATRSPPHQSPSVTASPQGEASGLCSPIRKKRPKSGHVHGPRNSLTTTPLRSTTPKLASGNERAIKKGGPGGKAPGALSSGFLRRKPGSRPESGGNPRRRSGPATVPTEPPADHRPPPSPGEFPRPQAGKESAIMF